MCSCETFFFFFFFSIARNVCTIIFLFLLLVRNRCGSGGIGAGSLELRADGTVHEVTLFNGSPAGSAKLGVLDELALALRTDNAPRIRPVARLLRTVPPPTALCGNATGQVPRSGRIA